MKGVLAIIGNAHHGNTTRAVARFLERLVAFGDVRCEIASLADFRIETCRGCRVCFEKGEERCPNRDDRDRLLAKIEASDGVVFASPNYAFQVSGLMKVFLDRMGFLCHRPRFHGKLWTSVVAQGFYGGGKIVRYLDFVGKALGFNVVRGTCLTTLDPMTEKANARMDRALTRLSKRFHARLSGEAYPVPSLFMLMIFRMGRMKVRLGLDERSRDFTYYEQKGWFESDYYYPVRLGLFKRVAGNLFDRVGGRMSRAAASAEPVRAASGKANTVRMTTLSQSAGRSKRRRELC